MSSQKRIGSRVVMLGLLLLAHVGLPVTVFAASAAQQADYDAAMKAAGAAMTRGPADVKLVDQAVLHLPAGFGFIPSQESAKLLRSMGNVVNEPPVGMVIPISDDNAGWFVVARFDSAGYIKDDDARDWNAKELLQNLKEGTEAANAERKQRGIPELEVIGWVEAPRYDSGARQLVWSISSKHKGEADDANRGINYNTYALGRDGYISMNLVTDLASVEAQKPVARQLLAGLEFNSGKRYADFDSSTDKVAAYGLAALVGGVAAKKLGLLAVIAAFAVKFAKVIALAAIGLAAGFAKWWKGRGGNPPAA